VSATASIQPPRPALIPRDEAQEVGPGGIHKAQGFQRLFRAEARRIGCDFLGNLARRPNRRGSRPTFPDRPTGPVRSTERPARGGNTRDATGTRWWACGGPVLLRARPRRRR
jgi:hypothetical protein